MPRHVSTTVSPQRDILLVLSLKKLRVYDAARMIPPLTLGNAMLIVFAAICMDDKFFMLFSNEDGDRTRDLRDMNPASYRCSTSRYFLYRAYSTSFSLRQPRGLSKYSSSSSLYRTITPEYQLLVCVPPPLNTHLKLVYGQPLPNR